MDKRKEETTEVVISRGVALNVTFDLSNDGEPALDTRVIFELPLDLPVTGELINRFTRTWSGGGSPGDMGVCLYSNVHPLSN